MSPLREPETESAPRPERHESAERGSARGRKRALFPLPLSAFERLFHAEDSPAYPIQFFCRMRFRGQLRQAVLNQALGIALARHPLLTAIVRPARDGSPYWVASPG